MTLQRYWRKTDHGQHHVQVDLADELDVNRRNRTPVADDERGIPSACGNPGRLCLVD